MKRQKYTLYILICWLLSAINPVLAKPRNTIPDSLQVLRFEVKGIVFSMQRVEGSVFVMGGTREQHREAISTDLPRHTVALDAYYIGHTEVTQALWQTVMNEEPLTLEGYNPNYPVTNISWYDCQTFIQRLDSITNMPFRLPTEAEWEFACRGGLYSKGLRYSGSDKVEDVAWFDYISNSKVHPIKEKAPNELGLYDMSGNLFEWCLDWYTRYTSESLINPAGPNDGRRRVLRGGCWNYSARNCRVSYRLNDSPQHADNYYGFRLAMSIQK